VRVRLVLPTLRRPELLREPLERHQHGHDEERPDRDEQGYSSRSPLTTVRAW
jgi:hypothetical protein